MVGWVRDEGHQSTLAFGDVFHLETHDQVWPRDCVLSCDLLSFPA